MTPALEAISPIVSVSTPESSLWLAGAFAIILATGMVAIGRTEAKAAA